MFRQQTVNFGVSAGPCLIEVRSLFTVLFVRNKVISILQNAVIIFVIQIIHQIVINVIIEIVSHIIVYGIVDLICRSVHGLVCMLCLCGHQDEILFAIFLRPLEKLCGLRFNLRIPVIDHLPVFYVVLIVSANYGVNCVQAVSEGLYGCFVVIFNCLKDTVQRVCNRFFNLFGLVPCRCRSGISSRTASA